MLRILLICSIVPLLGACEAPRAQQNGSAPRNSWDKANLACADVGIAPGGAVFDQCVINLYYSLWNLQNETDN